MADPGDAVVGDPKPSYTIEADRVTDQICWARHTSCMDDPELFASSLEPPGLLTTCTLSWIRRCNGHVDSNDPRLLGMVSLQLAKEMFEAQMRADLIRNPDRSSFFKHRTARAILEMFAMQPKA